jgi:hypothetical protein
LKGDSPLFLDKQEIVMTTKTKLSALALAAATFATTVLVFGDSASAQAAEDPPVDYEVGANLVCDTQTQAERFASVFAGDVQAAIRVINAEEHNPSACAIVNVAYMRGAKVAMARHGDKAFEVTRILVVGVETEDGMRPVRPAVYFSLFGVVEYAV